MREVSYLCSSSGSWRSERGMLTGVREGEEAVPSPLAAAWASVLNLCCVLEEAGTFRLVSPPPPNATPRPLPPLAFTGRLAAPRV